MIINTDELWADDRRRLADLLAGLPPTDSLYPIACRLQDAAAAPSGLPNSRWSRLLDRAICGALDLVEMVQAKRAVRNLTVQQFTAGATCASCHHVREDHTHYTRQTYCAQCPCETFEGVTA